MISTFFLRLFLFVLRLEHCYDGEFPFLVLLRKRHKHVRMKYHGTHIS